MRDDQPLWKIGRILSADAGAEDLVIVHSVPTGAIGVARYSQSPAPIVDWVGQLANRTVPESITTLVAGTRHIFFVRFHEVGALAPEEDWLRTHARVVRDSHFGLMQLTEFSPLMNGHF
jgi:hypothetical protein